MIIFLLKGLIRDRSRSLFPFLTVVLGVTLTVFGHSWIKGAQSPRFIDNEEGFLWLSEKDGFNHIYFYAMNWNVICSLN